MGDLADPGWEVPAAKVFAAMAEARGVPRTALLIESLATNTARTSRWRARC